jgi:hypothetical protein
MRVWVAPALLVPLLLALIAVHGFACSDQAASHVPLPVLVMGDAGHGVGHEDMPAIHPGPGAGHGGPGGHMMQACLAVLATLLTVVALLASLATRTRLRVRGRPGPAAPRGPGLAKLPRPPDLLALCVSRT